MKPQSPLARRLPAVLLASLVLLTFASPRLRAEAPSTVADDTRVIAGYVVRGGKLVPDQPIPASSGDRAGHEKIWSAVKTIIPPSLLGQIGRLEIFTTDAASGNASETDGYATLSESGEDFVLGLNLESATSAFIERDPEALKEYEATLIHEFGHVLSLNGSQMLGAGETGGGLELDEGRLKTGAWLNRFYELFWKQSYPDHGPATTSDEEGTALFNTAPSSFVTEYAATGPLEDFAETFSVFVLEPKPSGASIRAKKLLFFYNQPELVVLREGIRKGIAALK
jgi:hypothetical protein